MYTGAISDVLDEIHYRNPLLPTAIQGLLSVSEPGSPHQHSSIIPESRAPRRPHGCRIGRFRATGRKATPVQTIYKARLALWHHFDARCTLARVFCNRMTGRAGCPRSVARPDRFFHCSGRRCRHAHLV